MRLTFRRRLLAFAAAALMPGVPAEAYYHYSYYFNGNRSNPLHARFQLASNGPTKISFLVNDAGPANYASGDTLGSLVAEVKQALAAWNQVPSSQLKLVFGGMEQYPQNWTTPGVDVTFQDLPPGLLGYASPNLPAVPTAQTDSNGQFIPIVRSSVVLTNDTSQLPGPTYTEGFFTTAVHEIGHALGLQHTWTGAAMTPSVAGRNTNRARPIDADDIAALSVLYGGNNWTGRYGSISGRVTFSNNGSGVSLASVVALPVNGPAVSTLTNPDGSYTINGLPPNSYMVYVHPLPPDAVPANGEGLLLPETDTGATAAKPGGAFQTVFYPGTLDALNSASSLNISSGTNLTNINFSVRPQGSVSLYEVQTYSYIDPATKTYTVAPPSTYIGISPAFAIASQGLILVSATANSGSIPAPQSVTILGGFAPAPNCASNNNTSPCFSMYNGVLFGYFTPPPTGGSGPRHMVFNVGNDIYVLPNAVTLTQNPPPYVNSVNVNSDGTVNVSGDGLLSDTTVLFDGLQVSGVYSGSSNSINVTPPAGDGGQNSMVIAYNSDGQNSAFLQYPGSPVSNPPAYSFSSNGSPSFKSDTSSLPTTAASSGFSAVIDIQGTNTKFVDGQVTVGLGTTDATVSRVWVLSPTHLLANVVVAPNATIGSSEMSVVSGLQVLKQPSAFQIQTANPALPVIASVANSVSAQATIYPGASATITGTNLSNGGSGAQLSLTPSNTPGQPVSVQVNSASSDGTQITFQVPIVFTLGPAILTLNNGSGTVNLAVQVSVAPPQVAGVTGSNNAQVDSTHAANPDDTLTIQANGLDPAATDNPGRVQVTIGGLSMPVVSVKGTQIQVKLNHSFGGTVVPLLVWLDGSAGNAYPILVK